MHSRNYQSSFRWFSKSNSNEIPFYCLGLLFLTLIFETLIHPVIDIIISVSESFVTSVTFSSTADGFEQADDQLNQSSS